MAMAMAGTVRRASVGSTGRDRRRSDLAGPADEGVMLGIAGGEFRGARADQDRLGPVAEIGRSAPAIRNKNQTDQRTTSRPLAIRPRV